MMPAPADDAGFTLVELLIVTVLTPLVLGSLALALSVAFGVQARVGARVGITADEQITSAVFYQDVQQALMMTTSATAPQCGTGHQELGLEWGATYNDVISYSVVTENGTTTLVRDFCASGASSQPTATTPIANAIAQAQATPAIAPASSATTAAGGWSTTQGTTSVALTVSETVSTASFTLVGLPVASASSGAGG
jgi:hypothetical protein